MGGRDRDDRLRDDHRAGRGDSSRRHLRHETGEVGKDFANRYGGLFSEKDWKCPICSNINWARRGECNQCKTVKPGLDTSQGSREGRAGGFMERDPVVEYRRSRDAEKDDEWDEFGRRKKKAFVSERGTDDRKDSSGNDKEAVNGENEGVEDEGDGEEDEDDDRWAAWDDILGKDDGAGYENANRDRKTGARSASRRRSRSPRPTDRDRSMSLSRGERRESRGRSSWSPSRPRDTTRSSRSRERRRSSYRSRSRSLSRGGHRRKRYSRSRSRDRWH